MRFKLWIPVRRLNVCDWGIYDDGRFPGRSIISLHRHFDHLYEVPPQLLGAFMGDIQEISRMLMELPGVQRVNLAILGNAVSHVHAHLIPRYPGEAFPGKSPWNDPREPVGLSSEALRELVDSLQKS